MGYIYIYVRVCVYVDYSPLNHHVYWLNHYVPMIFPVAFPSRCTSSAICCVGMSARITICRLGAARPDVAMEL